MSKDRLKLTATELGNNIRLWRILKGYKQNDLAAKLAITRPLLSNIETGRTDVPLSRLIEIAAVLDIDVMLLFTPPNPLTIISNHSFQN